MTILHADHALTATGWQTNTRITIENGHIASLQADVEPQPDDERHRIILPGVANVHSHAFQRGMAGLAERRGTARDTFWSWREVMYRFALTMTPDQMEAIAALLYAEMLEAGFTRVGEFHYLHHAPDGRPYDDPAEMASRIGAAAETSGIGLTLLPVFYAHSNFGGAEPTDGQRRFITDLDGFSRLVERCQTIMQPIAGGRLGIAPHSLRAVTPDELESLQSILPDDPFHMHIAEQTKEVDDCLSWCGARPVDWLLDHAALDGRWCLIHATHMSDDETTRLAGTGAVAGLCPITEGNLGDGIFNAENFIGNGGWFGIGSDSNILIGLTDELRQLEYAQRLHHHERNVLAADAGSTGRSLFDGALEGGNAAMGVDDAGLAVGASADMVTLDCQPWVFADDDPDRLLDAWIFSHAADVDCVWVQGEKKVAGGHHVDRAAIDRHAATAMRQLR